MITVAIDLARVIMRQYEYIIKIYSVLIFLLVALLHSSLARSLCVCKDLYTGRKLVVNNRKPRVTAPESSLSERINSNLDRRISDPSRPS